MTPSAVSSFHRSWQFCIQFGNGKELAKEIIHWNLSAHMTWQRREKSQMCRMSVEEGTVDSLQSYPQFESAFLKPRAIRKKKSVPAMHKGKKNRNNSQASPRTCEFCSHGQLLSAKTNIFSANYFLQMGDLSLETMFHNKTHYFMKKILFSLKIFPEGNVCLHFGWAFCLVLNSVAQW